MKIHTLTALKYITESSRQVATHNYKIFKCGFLRDGCEALRDVYDEGMH